MGLLVELSGYFACFVAGVGSGIIALVWLCDHYKTENID